MIHAEGQRSGHSLGKIIAFPQISLALGDLTYLNQQIQLQSAAHTASFSSDIGAFQSAASDGFLSSRTTLGSDLFF